jgi:hypothetical protein
MTSVSHDLARLFFRSTNETRKVTMESFHYRHPDTFECVQRIQRSARAYTEGFHLPTVRVDFFPRVVALNAFCVNQALSLSWPAACISQNATCFYDAEYARTDHLP